MDLTPLLWYLIRCRVTSSVIPKKSGNTKYIMLMTSASAYESYICFPFGISSIHPMYYEVFRICMLVVYVSVQTMMYICPTTNAHYTAVHFAWNEISLNGWSFLIANRSSYLAELCVFAKAFTFYLKNVLQNHWDMVQVHLKNVWFLRNTHGRAFRVEASFRHKDGWLG